MIRDTLPARDNRRRSLEGVEPAEMGVAREPQPLANRMARVTVEGERLGWGKLLRRARARLPSAGK